LTPTFNAERVNPTPRFASGNDSSYFDKMDTQMFTCEDEEDDFDEKVT
tara:strand:+ start:39 stop:182 length:144 start_codon:yes stop_codon:yes gene_type:complete